MTNHTPTEGQMLTAWLISSGADRMRGDHQERFKAEFDRFIAKVKADALREAVEYFEGSVGVVEFREGTQRGGRHWADPDRAWEEQGPFMDWLRNHAGRVERGER